MWSSPFEVENVCKNCNFGNKGGKIQSPENPSPNINLTQCDGSYESGDFYAFIDVSID